MPTIKLCSEGNEIEIDEDTTAAELKQRRGIPEHEVVVAHVEGEAFALLDDERILDAAPPGSELSLQPGPSKDKLPLFSPPDEE